jgi:transcription initiation factor TFIIB
MSYKLLSSYEIENILNIDKPSKTKNRICPNCSNTDIIEDFSKGILICKCGQVIDSLIDNSEEIRIKDNNDDGNNAKNGLYYNRLLPQSSLCTTFNTKGKLKKLHIWSSMPYKERSDNLMFKKIHYVCIMYKITKKLEEDAKLIYKNVSSAIHTTGKNKGKPIITRGFNRSGIIAGCVFISCRKNNETRAVKELAYYFNITEKDVNKGLRSIQIILNDVEIPKETGTSKVIHFIKRKCDELHIKNIYSSIAYTIASNIDKLNIASNHTSYSLAAACILLMVDITKQTNINKKSISSIFYGLSDVTICKTYNQIKILKNILVNDAIVQSIVNEINEKNKQLTITNEIYEQMKLFNIDTSEYIVNKTTN